MDRTGDSIMPGENGIQDEELWRRYAETHDPLLREQLILGNLRLVYYAYGSLKPRLPAGMERDDAIACGIEGLIEAVDRYDVQRGHFSTIALPRIRGAMMDGMADFGLGRRRGYALYRRYQGLQEQREREHGREACVTELLRDDCF